jgi:pyruvate kinase
MSDIVIEAEKSVYAEMPVRELKGKLQPIDEIISQMSRPLAEKTGAKLILAASISGETGRLISRNRPELPIVVATSSERVLRQLNLSWGVYPIILEQCSTIEELVERAIVSLKKKKLVVAGDKIIVVAGEPVGYAGHVNLLEVKDIT